MKIVHLAAGAGHMYCGSCLLGNTLAAAQHRAGGDVLLAPLYTPLRTDEENVAVDRIAFGGINVYLQQHSAVFRHTPWFLDRLLDRPRLLDWATSRGVSIRPEDLGDMAVSMLRGEDGRQRKELEKLLQWLDREVRPDVVHLSNVMLAGLARAIHDRLGVPVVCTLSGEDIFLEKLPPAHYEAARAELRGRAADIDALVAMNGYYAQFMAEYLAVPPARIHVIPPGLNLDGHGTRTGGDDSSGTPAPRTIGYLARICHDKGLHQLLDAWRLLADDADMPLLRVRAAGYLDPADRPYLADLQRKLAAWGLADRFEYVGEPDRAAKIAFLQSLDVLSVPTVYRESKGLYVFEAWANAVPVVLPAHGAFPEMVADTGGGLLCEPGDAASLAAQLKQMTVQPQFAAECGRRAQEAVRQRYHDGLMAQRTMALYEQLDGKVTTA
jgi:glycosyltransferase involved in cell wall biosynthesis